MKLFILKKLANFGLSVLLEHKDFLIQTSSTVMKWWKGKKIAIIGPKETGKDALWNRLQGKDPLTPISLDTARVPHFKIDFRLSDGKRINLTVKRSLNIGGDENHRDGTRGWRAVCIDADIILYIITIDDLLNKKYLEGRIKEDMEWLYKNMPYLKTHSHLHILINKIDTQISSHTEYNSLIEKLSDELTQLNGFVETQLGSWHKVYTGSTLISTFNESLYLRGIENVFNAVYEHIAKQH